MYSHILRSRLGVLVREAAFMQDTDHRRDEKNGFQVCRDPWPGPGSEKDHTLLNEGKKLAKGKPGESWSQ